MASFLLPCCFCITNNITCTPECVTAPFFPNHMSTITVGVSSIFNPDYILKALDNPHPRLGATIFMKNLMKEAACRYRNPLHGNQGRYKALWNYTKQLEQKVAAQEAFFQQLRNAANMVEGPMAPFHPGRR